MRSKNQINQPIMIDFQTANSPFYEANKRFLEECITHLSAFIFSGWCNAYGYDVEGKAELNQLSILIQLKKHQTTQNGMLIPLNAHDNTELHIQILGLTSKEKLAIGINWFQSLVFGAKSTATSPLQKSLTAFTNEFKLNQLTLKNGTLNAQVYNSKEKPEVALSKLRSILNV
jgi:hypothetical protein